ncbi:MAG: ABC transporter ATP-binding protein [Bradymonadales bacterium]|nr:ABC transporter ATP-binding protein [Bradymonadales bacterium]
MISVEGLGKRYRIGGLRARSGTLRETLSTIPVLVWRRLKGRGRLVSEDFWALKEVSFEVEAGEVVGIIGRNGAGKSTLLKILSGITEPTEGRAVLRGRVGSLLEVGTGFHPELTGRENIYLSGAILGMRKAEIDKKFDEIVEFSGIEKFLDTPAKRYSSGMYVRLGFAVAAHLEPEILIIDEVLAVGDAEFQKKCLDKMGDVVKGGRTILFVSHNMGAITRLCQRTLLLEDGHLVMSGPSSEVTAHYLAGTAGMFAERVWPDLSTAPGNQVARLSAIRIRKDGGEISDTLEIRQPFTVEVEYRCLQEGARLVPNLHFFNDNGICVFISHNNWDREWYRRPHPEGLFKSVCHLPGNYFAEGRFTIMAAVGTINPTETHAVCRDAVSFQVVDHSEGDGARGDLATSYGGIVRPLLEWGTTVMEKDEAASG